MPRTGAPVVIITKPSREPRLRGEVTAVRSPPPTTRPAVLGGGWEPVVPTASGGQFSVSMRFGVWPLVLQFQYLFQLPHAVTAMEAGIMVGDVTELESMVSPILSQPTEQDGVSCPTRVNLRRFPQSFRGSSVHLNHPAIKSAAALGSGQIVIAPAEQSWVKS